MRREIAATLTHIFFSSCDNCFVILMGTAFRNPFSVFSGNLRLTFSKILDSSWNLIISDSGSTPKVKSSGVGKQQMINLKALSNAVFATVTVLGLGMTTHSASAQPQSILVTRGSHGAIAIVNDVPIGSTVLPTTPSQGYPTLINRGPGGAAQIVDEAKETKPMAQSHAFPKLMTRGSHGAPQLDN
jgi:hypothetical protein